MELAEVFLTPSLPVQEEDTCAAYTSTVLKYILAYMESSWLCRAWKEGLLEGSMAQQSIMMW